VPQAPEPEDVDEDDSAAAAGSEKAEEGTPKAPAAGAVRTLHEWISKGPKAEAAADDSEAVKAALEVLANPDKAQQLDKRLADLVDHGAPASQAQKMDHQLSCLEAAVREQKFSTRSPLGLVFFRTLAASQKQEYAALGNHAQKEAFRLRWAADRLKTVRSTSRREETATSSTGSNAEFVPLSVLVVREGGWEGPCGAENVKAALRYYRKAISLGPGWCRWNTFTERPEVKHVRHVESDSHATRHIQADDYEPTTNTVPALEDVPGEEEPAGSEAGKDANAKGGGPSKRKAANEPKGAPAKSKAKAKGEPAKKPAPAKPGEDLRQALAQAQKVRNRYMQATGSAAALIQTVQTEPSWQWTRTTPFFEKLTAALAAAQHQAYEESFVRDFIREPKTPATAAGLERVQLLEKVIDDLQKAEKRLQAVGSSARED
jgi:hypothetical protein